MNQCIVRRFTSVLIHSRACCVELKSTAGFEPSGREFALRVTFMPMISRPW